MTNQAENNVLTGIPYFTQLVSQTDDEAKARKAEIAGRTLARKLSSAYDDAVTQTLVAEGRLHDLYEAIRQDPTRGVSSFDVNGFVSITEHIKELESAKVTLAEEYFRLFGKALSVD